MSDVIISNTTNFEDIQTTSLYEHNSLKSNEINRLVEAVGVGKNYIASNFDLSFSTGIYTQNNVEISALYAILTPGIIVQDYTVINFQDHFSSVVSASQFDKTINIELFNENTIPGSNFSRFIGCSYHHGTYGDAINAAPTYASILVRSWTQGSGFGSNNPYFIPFYKLTFSGVSGISASNIKVERVIPHLKYDGPGQPIEVYKTDPEGFSVYGGGYDEDDGDAGLLWAVVL